MSGINLTKGSPSIRLDKRDIGSGDIIIESNWDRPPSGMDLDLGMMAKGRGGRDKKVIQALGGAFGSRRQFPFFQLSGDDRVGGTGEIITGTYSTVLEAVEWFGVFLYNYKSQTPLSEVSGAKTIVRFPGMRDIILTHESHDTRTAALLQVFNEGNSFRIQRDMTPINPKRGQLIQAAVDEHWGVGMRWTRASK